MTRLQLLQLVVGRARTNGFELRRWYTTRMGLPWISAEAALALLDTQRRYYALIFSHEFAQAFWKPGTAITFDVPEKIFSRTMSDGSVREIRRKGFIRRTTRPNAWRYHLREMALAEEPLRYLRKYLHLQDDSDTQVGATAPDSLKAKSQPELRAPAFRPLPTELPAFLQRPYRPKPAVQSR